MKHILFFVLAWLSISSLQAQQEAQFTQNGHNAYLLNPAMVGSVNEHQFRVFVRQNWAFFQDAPITLGASYQTLLKGQHGLGGLIYMDKSGPFRVMGLKASYSFHIPLSKKSRLAIGLSGKFYQNRIRTEDLVLINNNDLSINMAQARGTATTGDAEFGVYYYHPNFYIGVASSNLIQSKLSFWGVNNAKLYRHYYANAGAKIPVKADVLSLEPFVNFRMVNTLQPQIDAGLQFNIYKEQIKAGVLYRSSGYAGLYFAGSFDDNFLVSFSIDFIVNGLAKYGALNYEAILGYDMPMAAPTVK